MGGGGDSTPPMKNPLWVVFVQFFFKPAKLIYNFSSHANGDCQKFKIEEVEEILDYVEKILKFSLLI